ncbi:alpha/beta hydrolase [Pseudomonas sp.]|uniref:alpha/beta hydrolase n=1 Tax=Pseudomonas sp. TaxID=306 RepID=UPI002C006C29|nr:alpha/beta hydrolase [Pseudomonas sp.]HUE94837.1 alpha/beta hydrolase [Pseudomonas sp.]
MPESYPLSAQMAAFVAESQTHASADNSLAAQRAAYGALCRAFSPPRPAGLTINDLQLAEVAVRRYLPAQPAPAAGWPCLLYLHGGGWMLGDLDSHDFICAYLAQQLGLVVVAVAYRLAPEQPFPAALEDCMGVWQALRDGQLDVPLEQARLAVAGDSAGGNLAVAICLALRAAGQQQPCAQALIYPVLSALPLPSHQLCADAPLLTHAGLQACLDIYLADPEQRQNPLALPLAAPDFVGLPPAFVAAAEFDSLRDDAARYAERLALDGVPVEFEPGLGLVHGCLRGLGRVAEVDRLYQRLCAWLATAV